MIRGVGPVYAKKLVRAFGEKVFDVIEATPDRLREVDGIGPVRAASILAAWAEQKAVREIMVDETGKNLLRLILRRAFHGRRDRRDIKAPFWSPKRVATNPGCRQFAVTPVPCRRRASSRVNRMLCIRL
jgi:NAD-dependent DNA ligase